MGFTKSPSHLFVFTKGCKKLGVDKNDHLSENGKGVHFLGMKPKIKLPSSKYTVIPRLKTEAKHGTRPSEKLKTHCTQLLPSSANRLDHEKHLYKAFIHTDLGP